MERLIVDTGVFIAAERAAPVTQDAVPDDADIALAAITASELLLGVELADDRRRPARRATVDAILHTFDVLSFDLATAHHHAELLAHARTTGSPRGAHDMLIAATARACRRTILTTDARAFADLPGVDWRPIGAIT